MDAPPDRLLGGARPLHRRRAETCGRRRACTAMLAQVREPLLSVLRISPDFRPAYDPLLSMAAALARIGCLRRARAAHRADAVTAGAHARRRARWPRCPAPRRWSMRPGADPSLLSLRKSETVFDSRKRPCNSGVTAAGRRPRNRENLGDLGHPLPPSSATSRGVLLASVLRDRARFQRTSLRDTVLGGKAMNRTVLKMSALALALLWLRVPIRHRMQRAAGPDDDGGCRLDRHHRVPAAAA